jgi:ribonuclease Z
MKIPIVFLGTGQAIPTKKRNHTAMLLSYKDENILVDCGEGTQRQFRKAGINPCKLTRILISHWHGDHVLGLPGLLQTLALNNYSRTLNIYVPRGTRHYIDLMLKLFVFVGKINYKVEEVDGGKFIETEDFFIEAEKMQHGTPCLAYSFTEKEKIRINKERLDKLGIKGKIIGQLAEGKDIVWNNKKIKASSLIYKQESKKITFILDTKINPNCEKIAKDSDLLISESTYTKVEENLAEDYNHMTAEQAATIAKKSKSKRLILIHTSQRYENRERLVLQEAKKVFKNTEVVSDLDKVEV